MFNKYFPTSPLYRGNKVLMNSYMIYRYECWERKLFSLIWASFSTSFYCKNNITWKRLWEKKRGRKITHNSPWCNCFCFLQMHCLQAFSFKCPHVYIALILVLTALKNPAQRSLPRAAFLDPKKLPPTLSHIIAGDQTSWGQELHPLSLCGPNTG